MTGISVTLQ